ncbi:cation:proton antiporter [Corynebacterium sp. UBA2622]|uniref:cation:proton antiporter domain-containing protein n=1 Tax=Corynebacterium sp. UBA2622 TaxID=1946393 RepID=UPI0025C4E31E|nr:cation:proton antiporter [Corynebacterium sp. UBA2622]
MVFVLFIIVVSLLVIAFAEPLGERLGVVAPIILLALSVATAYLPQVPPVDVDPEIILQLILPPLLFSTAMRMPAHDFRRNFGAIFGLAVVLVVVTALCVGVAIHLLVPQVPLAVGVAVGAVVSPSDAVAVGIVKRAGVSRRIVAILDGEGLINDASALVVLSTALVAAGSKVSPGEVAGRFVWAVLGAAAVGYAVGKLFMFLRRYVHHPTSNTVLSLAIPFAAFLPAEEIGSSGLVSTVVAGLVGGRAPPRLLPPPPRGSHHVPGTGPGPDHPAKRGGAGRGPRGRGACRGLLAVAGGTRGGLGPGRGLRRARGGSS